MGYKIDIRLSFVLAILLLAAGCAKNGLIDSNELTDRILRFSPTLGTAQTATRAAELDNQGLKIASEILKSPHIIIHTYTGTPESSIAKYFSDELGYFSNGYWDVISGTTRFLPVGGMNLYGYFATDFADAGDLKDIEYTHPTATTYPKLTFTVTQDDALHQVDLIATKVENIANSNVMIPFRHILSQVNFGVKGIDRHTIIIKNIKLNKIKYKGEFDYNSWAWTPDNSMSHDYPYYFPDRNDRVSGSGTGANYITQGTDDDSKNTYIFGDGGKFGPGDASTFLYAQTDPTTTKYTTKANTNETLHNALMLIPQEITKNATATVTFDYEIKAGAQVIRSGVNSVVHLNRYYDWKPNLRYVYVFDFEDPSDKISFDVLINEWQNWDGGNGLKNGTIQEPTRATLNTIGDGETIYLMGLLERNLTWIWSDAAKYTFDRINSMTLDFSGVEMRGHSVTVTVPTGFTLSTNGNKRIITRNEKILLEPTPRQLNTQKNGAEFKLYGDLTYDLSWDWKNIEFASLYQNDNFILDLTGITFTSGKTITLILPTNVKASGTGVSDSKPYTISAAAKITIKDFHYRSVLPPTPELLNVVSDRTELSVNGGIVSTLGDVWNWSDPTTYTFANLDPQESFNLLFAGVNFEAEAITITLPIGFRAYTDVANKQNPYSVTANGTVTIKNNKINYPTKTYIEAMSDGGEITLAGETLPTDANFNWEAFQFPNLPPQASFTLDASDVDFSANKLKMTMPNYFSISGGTNSYTFPDNGASVVVRNNNIQKPTDTQLNNAVNSSVISMTNGRLFASEVWDWSTATFTSLGRSSNSFTLRMSGITLTPYSLDIKLPDNVVASGTAVSPQANNTYRITSGTGDVVITDNRIIIPTTTELNTISNGNTIRIKGGIPFPNEVWNWSTVAFTNLGAQNSFTLNFSAVNFDGKTLILSLPVGFIVSGTGATKGTGNTYIIDSRAQSNTITIKDNSYSVAPSTELYDKIKALTNGQTIVMSGALSGNWSLEDITLSITTPGQSIMLDFTRVAPMGWFEAWSWGKFAGYTITATNGALQSKSDNVFVINKACIVAITKI